YTAARGRSRGRVVVLSAYGPYSPPQMAARPGSEGRSVPRASELTCMKAPYPTPGQSGSKSTSGLDHGPHGWLATRKLMPRGERALYSMSHSPRGAFHVTDSSPI